MDKYVKASVSIDVEQELSIFIAQLMLLRGEYALYGLQDKKIQALAKDFLDTLDMWEEEGTEAVLRLIGQ